METTRQPRLARPTAIRLAIGLMVVMVIGTSLLGWRPRTAVLLCAEPTPPPSSSPVYSIEILKPLADSAQERLAKMGYRNITVRTGDGYRGWPEKTPFDIIIVAAAPDHVPQPLVEQLAPGGRLAIPVGRFFQELLLIKKRKDGTIRRESVAPVRFVPMRGEAEKAGR